jgi:hypothetical protein
MYHDFNFEDVLASSACAAWRLEDVLPEGAALDFGRNFLPEALARTGGIPFLSAAERRLLNRIRGHEYPALFALVEELSLSSTAAEVLPHVPLSVALAILQIEWMMQSHYLDSVRDDDALDPLFKPAPSSLDGGGPARQARHVGGRGERVDPVAPAFA